MFCRFSIIVKKPDKSSMIRVNIPPDQQLNPSFGSWYSTVDRNEIHALLTKKIILHLRQFNQTPISTGEFSDIIHFQQGLRDEVEMRSQCMKSNDKYIQQILDYLQCPYKMRNTLPSKMRFKEMK